MIRELKYTGVENVHLKSAHVFLFASESACGTATVSAYRLSTTSHRLEFIPSPLLGLRIFYYGDTSSEHWPRTWSFEPDLATELDSIVE
jgi:hypothetical protein